MWHASGRGKNESASRQIALDSIRGVGDERAGQWIDNEGSGRGIVHVLRRLSAEEREVYAVPEPYDIRGRPEEAERIAQVFAEAPYLRGRF